METSPTETRHLTVEDYLAHLAAPGPTPGGGSAVAVAAGIAAGLAEMVAGITLAGKHDPAASAELQETRDALTAARTRLLQLAADDEAAYAAYRAAATLPKSTDDERAARQAAIQRALLGSTDVPLAIAAAAHDVLERCRPTAAYGTKHALSDVSAAAMLAAASARGALTTAGVNVDLMRDDTTAARYVTQMQALSASIFAAERAIAEALASRMSS